MTSYAEGLQRSIPGALGVVRAEAASIVRRNIFGLGFLALVLFYYGLTPTFVPQEEARLYLFLYGRPGFPGSLLFALTGLFWGMAVWSDFPPGKRGPLLSLPLGRLGRLGLRSLAGVLVLESTVVGSLLLSGILCGWLTTGSGYFSAAFEFQLGGFLWTLLAVLNAYLLGTLLATWASRPDYWFLGVLFSTAMLAVVTYSFDLDFLDKLLRPLYWLVCIGTGVWFPEVVPYRRPEVAPIAPILVLGALLLIAVPISLAHIRDR